MPAPLSAVARQDELDLLFGRRTLGYHYQEVYRKILFSFMLPAIIEIKKHAKVLCHEPSELSLPELVMLLASGRLHVSSFQDLEFLLTRVLVERTNALYAMHKELKELDR